VSTRRLVVWIAFLAMFAMAARVSVDHDTWWHLRAGMWIVENRAVPQTDSFSYTRAGESWQYPGWLVEVPMYLIYRYLGPGGLNLWTAGMVTLAFLFVWGTLSGGPFLRAFVIVLAAAASGVYWAARPYLATIVLAAAFLWFLEAYHWQPSSRSEKRLWWLPVLMVLWANSHGGFAVGFILWGIYWFTEALSLIYSSFFQRSRSSFGHSVFNIHQPFPRLTLIGLLMVLAVCINPSGPLMLAYPFKTVSIAVLQEYIQEWQSPNFHLVSMHPFIWLLLATFGAVGVSRRRLALTDFLLVSGFTYMSLLAGRNVALFALVAPAVLTRHAAPVLEAVGRVIGYRGLEVAKPQRGQAVLNASLLCLLALAVLIKAGMQFPRSDNEKVFRENFPVQAVDFIKVERPPGRLFNSYNWGAYLLWELPDYPVFVDGRTDLYNEEVLGQWLQVVRGENGWQGVLDQWDVRLILLEPNMPVLSQLESWGWKKVYGDKMAVVYVR
jgi:hypothetical protein